MSTTLSSMTFLIVSDDTTLLTIVFSTDSKPFVNNCEVLCPNDLVFVCMLLSSSVTVPSKLVPNQFHFQLSHKVFSLLDKEFEPEIDFVPAFNLSLNSSDEGESFICPLN